VLTHIRRNCPICHYTGVALSFLWVLECQEVEGGTVEGSVRQTAQEVVWCTSGREPAQGDVVRVVHIVQHTAGVVHFKRVVGHKVLRFAARSNNEQQAAQHHAKASTGPPVVHRLEKHHSSVVRV